MEHLTKVSLIGLITGGSSLAAASRTLSLDASTVRRARQDDPDFDRQVREALEQPGTAHDGEDDGPLPTTMQGQPTNSPQALAAMREPIMTLRTMPDGLPEPVWVFVDRVQEDPVYASNLRIGFTLLEREEGGPLSKLIDWAEHVPRGERF